MVYLYFHRVNAGFIGGHLIGHLHTELRQRVNSPANLRLHQTTEFHHLAGNRSELAVELGR